MSKKFAYLILVGFIFLCILFSVPAEAENLELIPPVDQEKGYSADAEGFKELLFDLYQLGKEDQYTIQFSGVLDLIQTTIGADQQQSEPTFETIGLSDVSANLTFKGIGAEAQLFLPDICFFGQAVQFEGLNLAVSKIYGNGHQVIFKNIQHDGNTQVFGGSNRDLVADPKLVFQQVSGGTWEIVGGNEMGDLTGNPSTQIIDMTGAITQLCGGSLAGKIIGTTTTEVRDFRGELTNYYGGGVGTAAAPVELTGGIKNLLCSASSDFTLGNFVGGVAFGQTGAINTLVEGQGSFSLDGIFIGGSQSGVIVGKDKAITTKLDTRQFQNGERNFVGGNQYNGRIVGDIENEIYAGTVDKGSFNRIDGAGGMEIEKRSLTNSPSLIPDIHLTDSQIRTEEELVYDQHSSAERFSLAKGNTAFLVEGNVTTRLLGGCVSGGLGTDRSVRGAGFAGVINGDVTLVLGEESLVYSKTWGTNVIETASDPNNLPNNDKLATRYGFNAAAGGGDNRSLWETTLYIRGNTELIAKQALMNTAYGGSFSGIIEGNCLARVLGGQIHRINGAGNSCYRIYGDCRLEIAAGKIEDHAIAGGEQDRRVAGNLHGEISGGEFLGLVAASYGLRPNHIIDGNAELFIRGGRFKKKSEDTQIMGGLVKEGLISGNVILKLTDSIEGLSGMNISAARPKNASNKNILGNLDKHVGFEFSTEQNFSEVTVLGDGGTDAKSLISPTIALSLNTPNGDFSLIQGMIKNSRAGSLTHEIAVDIQAAQSVDNVIGSDLTSFTNRLIADSEKQVKLRFGGKKEKIAVDIIKNFTHLNITNQLSARSILNGSGATNENFAQDYHQFGEVLLTENAELAVRELKTGELIATKTAELHSPARAEAIFLRKLLPEEKLVWRLLEPENQQAVSGDYFSQQMGYSVMTFAGSESFLTPENFIGFDERGHSYTGDRENQIGLAVAATIIDYQTTDLLGEISHNLALQADNHPLPLAVWGAGNKQQGSLIIPANTALFPKLTFIETDQFSFQQAMIHASNGEEKIVIESFWEPYENYYYQVQVLFQPTEGSLKLVSVPQLFDFGTQSIGTKELFYPQISGKLVIKDTRKKPEPWQLTLQAETSDLGAVGYQEAEKTYLLNEAVAIISQSGSLETSFADWSDQKGVFLKAPKERQKLGNHTLTFHWRLVTKVE